MSLTDDELRKFGNTVQLIGGVWAGEGKAYLCLFPEESGRIYPGLGDGGDMEVFLQQEEGDALEVETLSMSPGDWDRFLRQTDLMETEILAKAKDGTFVKAVARKSSRQIEQNVSWQVFKRDGYACRYCGRDDVPLTVDHLVRWEEGGPSIAENLLSACRKCNKTRGNKPYVEWLAHAYYRQVAKGLNPSVLEANIVVAATLASIPRKAHVHTR